MHTMIELALGVSVFIGLFAINTLRPRKPRFNRKRRNSGAKYMTLA